MKYLCLLSISLLFVFSSCRPEPDEDKDETYNVVMDSIVVTKFSMTDENGNPWDFSDNPDIQIEFYSVNPSTASTINIKTNPIFNTDNTQDRSFGLLNWQLGTKTEQEHTYQTVLYDNDNGASPDYVNAQIVTLTKRASPLNIISTDGRFEATLYYHH